MGVLNRLLGAGYEAHHCHLGTRDTVDGGLEFFQASLGNLENTELQQSNGKRGFQAVHTDEVQKIQACLSYV